jgi:hypothetical protein
MEARINPKKLPPHEWAEFSDTQLSKLHGGTRQKWSDYRKRHKKPASPAGHGGFRHGKTDTPRRISVPWEKAVEIRRLAKLPLEKLRTFC